MLDSDLKALSPYPSLRPGQLKIAKTVYQAIFHGFYVFVEAPCGLGKTLASLLGIFYLLNRNPLQRILWLTRTNNESDKVIEEAKNLKSQEKTIKGLSLRGKSQCCLYLQGVDENLIRIACKVLRGEVLCPYLNQEWIDSCVEQLDQDFDFVTAKEVVDVCKKHKACPHIVMKKLAHSRQLLVFTYPYMFNKNIRRAYLQKLLPRSSSPISAIIDEAHNILDLVADYNSSSLRISTLYNSIDELYLRGETRLAKSLEYFATKLESLAMKSDLSHGVEIPRNFVNQVMAECNEELPGYLNKLKDVALNIIAMRATQGLTIRCYTHSVYVILKSIVTSSDNEIVWLHLGEEDETPILEVKPLTHDITAIIKPLHSVVFMSGTLSPITAYITMLNLNFNRKVKVMKYVRPKHGYALLIIDTSLSTSLKERSDSLFKKIAYKLKLIRERINGGLGVFISSYSILKSLEKVGLKDLLPGLTIVSNREGSLHDMEPLLRFKDYVAKGLNSTLITVVGGRLSEGVDIPSSIMPLAVIVGMPVPEPNLYSLKRVEKLKSSGAKAPHDVVFLEPAIRKVAQTIGRLIRSPHSKAYVILMDRRYQRDILIKYMPKWLKFTIYTTDNSLSLLCELLSLEDKIHTKQ